MKLEAAVPYAGSIALHALVLGLLALGAGFVRRPEVLQPMPIEAAVVDEQIIEALTRLRRESDATARAEAARRQQEQQEQIRLEQERIQAEIQASREAERLEQEQREAEAQRQAELEAQRQAELEAQRQAEAEEAARREAEAQEAARRKREAEAKALAEREGRERARREADLQARLAEEERRAAAVSSGQRAQYVAMIQARIQRNWIRPASARPGLSCTVRVTQIPGGEVVDATLGACNGDEAVRQSIISAVLRSSPLPPPPDPSLFERNLVLEFVPED